MYITVHYELKGILFLVSMHRATLILLPLLGLHYGNTFEILKFSFKTATTFPNWLVLCRSRYALPTGSRCSRRNCLPNRFSHFHFIPGELLK
jgi:hypothetical protein